MLEEQVVRTHGSRGPIAFVITVVLAIAGLSAYSFREHTAATRLNSRVLRVMSVR